MSLQFEVTDGKDDKFAVAEARHMNAKAADQETLTELKSSLAGQAMWFLWMWFGALILFVLTYVSSLLATGQQIPKEVVIAIFTSTAAVVGLVGYILKGLFGNNK